MKTKQKRKIAKIGSRTLSAVIACLLLLAAALCFAGCALPTETEDVTKAKTESSTKKTPTNQTSVETPVETPPETLVTEKERVTDFAVRLFRATSKGEAGEADKNILVSPLSVLYALAMTANGANGETRAQMESTLGMKTEDLNVYLRDYAASLAKNEGGELHVANSIWFTDNPSFTVNQSFLQTNADYYNAGIFRAPFDQTTCDSINNWVKQETDDMIPSILDQIPDDAVMYLVNALAFKAEWWSLYSEDDVRDGTFTRENGQTDAVKMMYSKESRYLEDDGATGFIKYYAGRSYAFVALLPKEGTTVAEYLETLDGASLSALLANAQSTTVQTAIPTFETDCSVKMSNVLKEMGMQLPFDSSGADFKSLGVSTGGNIFINNILHKTTISVTPKGTVAGAATAVECGIESVEPAPQKEVCLDRPFVYLLIDCENNIPFFIGTQMQCGNS